ncbi:MAG TPA: hypothetical protein ENJ23_00455 [Bacteroidetes bacterium]|nr:hypothetical protein [Bacteroidota bacterium]
MKCEVNCLFSQFFKFLAIRNGKKGPGWQIILLALAGFAARRLAPVLFQNGFFFWETGSPDRFLQNGGKARQAKIPIGAVFLN